MTSIDSNFHPWIQPLPSHLSFSSTNFIQLTNWARNFESNLINPSPYIICPIIPCYRDVKQRNIQIARAHEEDKDDYKAGYSISSSIRYFPSRIGGVGVIVSPYDNATQTTNTWHAVAIVRQGSHMAIYDPTYIMKSHSNGRFPRGLINVQRLGSNALSGIQYVWIQGPPTTTCTVEQDCMGRSAQMVEALVSGQFPWPFPPGYLGDPPGFDRIRFS